MYSSLLITLREGVEAALIIGVVLAIVRQTGISGRVRHVWLGVASALVVSVIVGGVLTVTGRELQGTAEAVFEGGTALVAAVVLTGMIIWMRRQAADSGAELRAKTASALNGGGRALFWVAFVAVVREGIETALFLFAASGAARPLQTLTGATIGLAVAVGAGIALSRGTSRLDLRAFFTVSSVLLIGFATYLLASALHEFGELLGSELLEGGAFVAAAAFAVGALWLLFHQPRSGSLTPA